MHALRRATLTLLLLPTLAAAQQATRDSVISVTASRTVRVAPDRATLFVTVEGTAESSSDALARVDSKLKGIGAALRGLGAGVTAGAPTTVSVSPTPNNRGFPSAPSANTLTARAAFKVQVSDIAMLARVFAAATDAGAASTGALTFESSAADSIRRAEMAIAIQGARLDAEAIARALGARVVGFVDANTNVGQAFSQPATLPSENFGGSPLFAPEVTLTVTVGVRFRLMR